MATVSDLPVGQRFILSGTYADYRFDGVNDTGTATITVHDDSPQAPESGAPPVPYRVPATMTVPEWEQYLRRSLR